MAQSADPRPTLGTYGAPRDRRSGKRIFTTKNVLLGSLALVALAFFISYLSEFRHTDAGKFGGLYSRRTVDPVAVPKPHYEVVTETRVSESNGADPLALETARREQMLGVTSTQSTMASPVLTATDPASPRQAPDFRPLSLHPAGQQSSSRFRITGGADGVTAAVK